MWTKRILSLLLCCLFLVAYPGMCSASYYQITPEELATVERNLTQLQTNLEKQDKLLQAANEKLITSDQTIERLNNQLTRAEQLISQTQNSLQKLEQYCKELEKEAKRKNRGIGLYASTESFGAMVQYDNVTVFGGPKHDGGYEVGAAVLFRF